MSSLGAGRLAGRGDRWLAGLLVALVLVGWAATVGTLVLTAGWLLDTAALPPWWVQVIAVGMVAATVVPVHRWVRPRIDDVVYGPLDDAYRVVTELNRQIHLSFPAEPAARDRSVASMIARALNVPYVSVVEDEVETSAVGQRPTDRELTRVPLTYRGTATGYLLVAARHAGTPLSNRDLNLLTDLAQQLGVSMFAVRASEQLQASRAALVQAREEERRRIRRDLHDGLGPALASVKLQLTAVQRLLPTEPARAAAMIGEVRAGIDETTADIRRLVYGLRPPLLDDLGLVAALRNRSAHIGLELTVMPDQIPELPAAIEVALYRIASEAIQNAVRHSGGRRCNVTISVGSEDRALGNEKAGQVCMTISDDGRGLPDPMVNGVGMSAIRERAAELGGTVTVVGTGGTRVVTVIPLRPGARP